MDRTIGILQKTREPHLPLPLLRNGYRTEGLAMVAVSNDTRWSFFARASFLAPEWEQQASHG
jgi:hypothetical protein